MSTFTDGIKSMLSKPVEKVKESLQKIRNLLPFSDAKEGPLSSLTLSGSKVLSTMTEGIQQTENLPAQEVEAALGRVDLTMKNNSQGQKTNRTEDFSISTGGQTDQTAGTTVIKQLTLNVDLKTIEDIQKLRKLIHEIEDSINSSGGGTPEPA